MPLSTAAISKVVHSSPNIGRVHKQAIATIHRATTEYLLLLGAESASEARRCGHAVVQPEHVASVLARWRETERKEGTEGKSGRVVVEKEKEEVEERQDEERQAVSSEGSEEGWAVTSELTTGTVLPP
mmetsp:Transcript_16657/g.52076  ORF Transcript_16657/g.52076 Transcript_16657/m.52076 type:complete len:128 (-) Transcript_16657:503-886(-)